MFHKCMQSEKRGGLAGPSQQVVDISLELVGTVEEVQWELPPPRFEPGH